jgi:hypothetical protein
VGAERNCDSRHQRFNHRYRYCRYQNDVFVGVVAARTAGARMGKLSHRLKMLRALGSRSVHMLDESWLGYRNSVAAPADALQLFSIRMLNGQMSGLESNVQKLTAEIQSDHVVR